MDLELRDALINDFVTRSFRDVADKDYIAARILHRYNLDPQFLWAALQAIEKYLKGILLYNRVSTKGLSHDIVKGLERLSRIRDIPFQIPDDVKKFITYLNGERTNRYFEHPAFVLGREIFSLDRTVWHLRRYCYWMRGQHDFGAGQVRERLPLEIQGVHSVSEQQAHKYRILGGISKPCWQSGEANFESTW
jgi:HEPN domain-containing protein